MSILDAIEGRLSRFWYGEKGSDARVISREDADILCRLARLAERLVGNTTFGAIRTVDEMRAILHPAPAKGLIAWDTLGGNVRVVLSGPVTFDEARAKFSPPPAKGGVYWLELGRLPKEGVPVCDGVTLDEAKGKFAPPPPAAPTRGGWDTVLNGLISEFHKNSIGYPTGFEAQARWVLAREGAKDAEIARLRGALQTIADSTPYDNYRRVARDALGGKR